LLWVAATSRGVGASWMPSGNAGFSARAAGKTSGR
jgi:hypothetical protein